MKPRKPLTNISGNPPAKPRKVTTYGKTSRRSFEDSASTLFDAAISQEKHTEKRKPKRRVTFSDPLIEEISENLYFGKPSGTSGKTQSLRHQRVNRVLRFDSDEDEEHYRPQSAPIPKKRLPLPSLIDEARWHLEIQHDPDWYPETQPDDLTIVDKCPWVSLEDENCSLLIV